MFLSKTNSCLRSKNLAGYVDNFNRSSKHGKECLYVLQTCNYNVYGNTNANQLCFTLCHNKNGFSKRDILLSMQIKGSLIQWSSFNRKLCTNNVPKDANIFGDLSYKRYEKVEMDEAEKEEERFTENDAKIQKWQKSTPGQYCKLIKSHIQKRNLQLALNVLHVVKENRDKPTVYMYGLLIRAFALQGDIKQCFQLYFKMKQYRLIPNAAIYNSLINSCAVSTDETQALKYLHYLRQHFYETNYALNETHYATLIKGYAWHKQIMTAFELADEAQDKGLVARDIYSALFHATISDTKNGLKYAIILWHKMRIKKLTPNIFHYNLLLRAIRDAAFEDMKINDPVLLKSLNTEIQIDETQMSDLLDFPPRINTSIFSLTKKYLPNKPRDTVSNDSDSKLKVTDKNVVFSQCLSGVLKENPLVLFGGTDKLLKRMESDNVTPDTKTATLLVELLPPSEIAENFFLRYIESKKVKLDIGFFNMLITKRNLRNQYKQAKDVLYEVQRHHLIPDILTFGALAIGCKELTDGIELLEQMNCCYLVPNSTILETLLQNGTSRFDNKYVLYLMSYIMEHEVRPTSNMLNTLDSYQKSMLDLIRKKNRYNRKEVRKAQTDYNQFAILYDKLKEQIQKDNIVKMSKSTENRETKRRNYN